MSAWIRSRGLGMPSAVRRSGGLAWAFVLLLSLGAGTAWAGSARDADVCLNEANLDCAREVLESLREDDPGSDETLRVGLWVAFHEGRYDAVQEGLNRLAERGIDVEADEHQTPYRATVEAAHGMVEVTGNGVRVRHLPGVDQVLVDEALDTLQRSRLTYDGIFAGGPQHDIVLDIFPSATRFIGGSGLAPSAVRTTGVVALSKWTRLLLTSPRALSRGYAWKDTVAHEYIHLVVSYQSRNRAPVWLQEGLAKHLEGFWRGQTTRQLAAHHQSLLARAVQTGEFVPFEKFRRSMAYLDSGDEAALAFAQVSTMIEFLIEIAGLEVLPEVMRRIGEGEAAEHVVADQAGFGDFDGFREGWLAWLSELPLIQKQLSPLPVVLDGEGDEYASDPLLASRPELVRYSRLGDLLRSINRPKAALIEYEKAMDSDGPPSPLLLARQATCYQMLDQHDKALEIIDEAVEFYPEYTLIQVTRGRLLDHAGRVEESVQAWRAAHDLNPYDPEVQRALVRNYTQLGRGEEAARHQRYERIIATAGVLTNAAADAPRTDRVSLGAFTVHLPAGDAQPRVLEMDIAAAGDQLSPTLLREQESQIRDAVLRAVSELGTTKLQQPDGREQLKAVILRRVNEVLAAQGQTIEQIHFTTFVMK